jgi:hypothetical protein
MIEAALQARISRSTFSTTLLIVGVFLLAFGASGLAAPPHEALVGTDWVWFTDYGYLSAEWTLNAEEGCDLEVGAGIKVGGKPRGSIYRFSGYKTITTWGIGAIHVRAVDGVAPCLVRVDEGRVRLIGVYSDPSVVKGVIHDGKIVFNELIKERR